MSAVRRRGSRGGNGQQEAGEVLAGRIARHDQSRPSSSYVIDQAIRQRTRSIPQRELDDGDASGECVPLLFVGLTCGEP
jgi:hypothetical protein